MTEKLDGNAAAGTLADIFGAEMTLSLATCASCGARGQVGALVVYLRGPGTVIRCPACESVLMKITEARGVYCLDMSGVSALRVAGQ
ncbi:MAG: DUF6510 family protein [Actinomycetota bacterium]